MRRLGAAFAFALAFAFTTTMAFSSSALAQPADEPGAGDKAGGDKTGDKTGDKDAPAAKEKRGVKAKEKLFDFTALKLDGSTRMPQLLYFLERASAELERASLKRRSFVPEMVRSMDEDAL